MKKDPIKDKIESVNAEMILSSHPLKKPDKIIIPCWACKADI